MAENRYQNGDYAEKNPDWHADDAPWKAERIIAMMKKHALAPLTVTEVGCGCGEILAQLQPNLDPACELTGYDIAPEAIARCQSRANTRLRFRLGDMTQENGMHVELLLIIDVIEHLENYFAFLRALKPMSTYTILHIPLEISAQAALRGTPFLRVREQYGHIHHFNREIALQLLSEIGYQVVDWTYTSWATERPAKTWQTRLARLPRLLTFALNRDMAARLLGGYSLLVLAR